MIENIVLDLDGTMIGSSGLVEDCVWDVIQKARAKGIKFYISTGRPGFGLGNKIAKKLGETQPHIFQHGAEISYTDGKMLKVFSLPEQRALEILQLSRDKNLMLELYTTTSLYIEENTDFMQAHARSLGTPAIVRDLEDVIKNEPVLRAQFVMHNKLDKGILDGLNHDDLYLGFGVSGLKKLQDYIFVSYTQQSASKGNSLKLLAEKLRFSLDKTMAIGDSNGDVSMLDVVAYPVIMGNAPEELKEKYEQVAGHVDKCGIVEVIEDAISNYPS